MQKLNVLAIFLPLQQEVCACNKCVMASIYLKGSNAGRDNKCCCPDTVGSNIINAFFLYLSLFLFPFVLRRYEYFYTFSYPLGFSSPLDRGIYAKNKRWWMSSLPSSVLTSSSSSSELASYETLGTSRRIGILHASMCLHI